MNRSKSTSMKCRTYWCDPTITIQCGWVISTLASWSTPPTQKGTNKKSFHKNRWHQILLSITQEQRLRTICFYKNKVKSPSFKCQHAAAPTATPEAKQSLPSNSSIPNSWTEKSPCAQDQEHVFHPAAMKPRPTGSKGTQCFWRG